MARQEAKQRTNSFKRHVAAADDELKEARSRWRRALRNVGLPESLTPKHVRQLAAHQVARPAVPGPVGRSLMKLLSVAEVVRRSVWSDRALLELNPEARFVLCGIRFEGHFPVIASGRPAARRR